MTIIGLSAKARGGKDEAASVMKEYIESHGKKAVIIHYADPLKWVLKQFYGWDGQKDEAGRTLLQHVGTEVFRHNYEDVWVDIVKEVIRGWGNEYDFIIIPDCRFVNEIKWISEASNGVTIRIIRDQQGFDNGLTEEQKNHPSETSLDNYTFDYKIYNSGSVEEYHTKIKRITRIIEELNETI